MTAQNLSSGNSLLERLLGKESRKDISDCQTCAKCVSVCSWYDAEGAPNPRQLVRMAIMGMEDELAGSPMLWQCMMCNRCGAVCPMEIDIGNLVRKARSLPGAEGSIPESLTEGISNRLKSGNVNDLPEEDYIDTLEWLSEEMQGETGDETAEIPVDQKAAKYMYLPNPREIELIPMHLLAMCNFLRATGESWTMSSKCSDVTNWGFFIGNDEISTKMLLQVVEAVEALEIDTLIMTECGHGFIVLRKYAEQWLGRKLKFKVLNIIEFVLQKTREGVFELDPNVTDEAVAYHDPCKVGRGVGLFDAPRELLSLCCKEVVELSSYREHSICCGGGGGFLQDSTSKEKRMIAGKAKADQMGECGVTQLATSCLSCHRQLSELSKEYKLGVNVTTVSALAAKALVKK